VITKLRSTQILLTAVVAGTLVMACGGGPSEKEFVDACLKEGQGAASTLLDKELGVSREAYCNCGAKVAKDSLSSDGYRAMVLDMQGKRAEASAITSKMSEAEQTAAVTVAGEMLEKCVAAK
jgi:hypothetical protein